MLDRNREGAIGLLWLAGGLLPLITLGRLAAEQPDVSVFAVLQVPLFVPLAFVGASMAARPGAAPIAWVFLAIGATSGVAAFAESPALAIVPHVLLGSLVLAMLPTGWLPEGRARWLALPSLLVGGVRFAIAVSGGGSTVLDAVWPWTVALLSAWLLLLARDEAGRGRRRVFRRVAVLALCIPFGFIAFLAAGADAWLWVFTVALLVIQIDVAVITARREGLWGMSALVHRTVLWAALSAVVAAVYAVAVPLAALAGLRNDVELALALGLGAAVAAYAALDRELRVRLVGEGDDAPRALARLHDALRSTPSPAAELTRAATRAVRGAHATVELVVAGDRRHFVGVAAGGAADALGAPAAAGRLPADPAGAGDAPAVAGRPPGDPAGAPVRLTLPVVHAGRVVGFLSVALPAREELGERERRLLAELVAAAAPALDAERLTLEPRERVASVLEERVIAPLTAIAADLRAGADEARVAAAYASAGAMVAETRRLAHALASGDELDPGPAVDGHAQLAADLPRAAAHRR